MHTKFDKIKYTVTKKNETGVNIPAEIEGEPARHILPSNLTDYQMCITNLEVPTYDVPFLRMPMTGVSPFTVAVDYYDAPTQTWFRSDDPPPSTVTQVSYIPRTGLPLAGGLIYQISQFIEMINAAISEALDSLDTNVWIATGHHLSIQDPITGLYPGSPMFYLEGYNRHLVVKAKYSDWGDTMDWSQTSLTPRTGYGLHGGVYNLYVNRALFLKISGVDNNTIENEAIKFRILFHNYGNNLDGTTGLLTNFQQRPIYSTMSEVTTIVVVTNLPVQNTYLDIGSVNNVVLELDREVTFTTLGSSINYDVDYPSDWKDIISPTQINQIWFKIYYIDISGTAYQLFIPPRSSAKITMMFQRKATSNF